MTILTDVLWIWWDTPPHPQRNDHRKLTKVFNSKNTHRFWWTLIWLLRVNNSKLSDVSLFFLLQRRISIFVEDRRRIAKCSAISFHHLKSQMGARTWCLIVSKTWRGVPPLSNTDSIITIFQLYTTIVLWYSEAFYLQPVFVIGRGGNNPAKTSFQIVAAPNALLPMFWIIGMSKFVLPVKVISASLGKNPTIYNGA